MIRAEICVPCGLLHLRTLGYDNIEDGILRYIGVDAIWSSLCKMLWTSLFSPWGLILSRNQSNFAVRVVFKFLIMIKGLHQIFSVREYIRSPTAAILSVITEIFLKYLEFLTYITTPPPRWTEIVLVLFMSLFGAVVLCGIILSGL